MSRLASKRLVPVKEAKNVLHGLKGKKGPRKGQYAEGIVPEAKGSLTSQSNVEFWPLSPRLAGSVAFRSIAKQKT